MQAGPTGAKWRMANYFAETFCAGDGLFTGGISDRSALLRSVMLKHNLPDEEKVSNVTGRFSNLHVGATNVFANRRIRFVILTERTTHNGNPDPANAVSIASEIGAVLLPIRDLTVMAAKPVTRQIERPFEKRRSIDAIYQPRCHAHHPSTAVLATFAVI